MALNSGDKIIVAGDSGLESQQRITFAVARLLNDVPEAYCRSLTCVANLAVSRSAANGLKSTGLRSLYLQSDFDPQ